MPFPVLDASELGEQTRRVLDRFHAQLRSWIGHEHRGDGTHGWNWVDVTFAPTNFTASAGTWTVGESDQLTYAYTVHGSTMTVAFEIAFTSTSSGMGDELRIAIPAGYVASLKTTNPIFVTDSGTGAIGMAQVDAGATYIKCFRNPATDAWTDSATNTTHVEGQITFAVS